MERREIKTHIESFLAAMAVSYDRVEDIEHRGYVTFMIYSKEARHLIGARGEALEALRHLLHKTLQKKEPRDVPFVFTIDVNHYYTKKLASLMSHVDLAAKRVRLFRRDIELSPMGAYERMIVHSAFAEDPEIVTESVGTGKFRHVVLRCAQNRGSLSSPL